MVYRRPQSSMRFNIENEDDNNDDDDDVLCCALHERKKTCKTLWSNMLKGKLSRNTRLRWLHTFFASIPQTQCQALRMREKKMSIYVCMRACSKQKLAKQIWCVFRRESVSNGVQFVVRFEWDHNEPPINLQRNLFEFCFTYPYRKIQLVFWC